VAPFGARERKVEQDGLRRVLEALQVLFQAEHVAAVEPDPLKHAVPVKQPVVEDRHLGVGLVHKPAIEIDLHAPMLRSAPKSVESLES
jgi:hypothetical protein